VSNERQRRALIRAASLSANPLLSAPASFLGSNLVFSRLSFQRFISPVVIAANSRLSLARSSFHHFLSSVARIDSTEQTKGKVFTARKDLSSAFTIAIISCAFMDIKSDLVGGAFFVQSQTHILQLERSQFIRCETTGSALVGHRLNPVGAGAFTFEGARCTVSACVFGRCSADADVQVLLTSTLHDGRSAVTNCLLSRNGRGTTDWHTLFCLDNGAGP